jgi:hypothetical protein
MAAPVYTLFVRLGPWPGLPLDALTQCTVVYGQCLSCHMSWGVRTLNADSLG